MACHADRYALFGNPVAHSLSPDIHAAFAAQTGEALRYEKYEIAADDFANAVDAFFATGGKGLNVTLPFKADACACATRLTERARDAHAANTLWRDADNALVGDNTDGIGFIRDLTVNYRFSVAGKNVLLLGAGGVARGVLGPLLERGPARLHIANRTAERAVALAGSCGGPVTAGGLEDWPDKQFDLIVDATAAGQVGAELALPPVLLGPECACYSLSYGVAAEPFLEWARAHGAATTLDGWGMLVEQAAESFYLWRGVRPETSAIIADRAHYLTHP